MKLLSWNVNGIRACVRKNCLDQVPPLKADIVCVQETKCPEKILGIFPQYPYHFWNCAVKAGYAGTAIFSTVKPLAVRYGMDIQEHDQEGRIICAEFEHFFLVNVYVPNSGRGLPRLEYRQRWDKDFLSYLRQLEKKKPVIACGDFNVAHKPIDLANPKENYNKTAGFTQVEIDGMDNVVNAGFIDTFREFNTEAGQYTFWAAWNNLRARNIGWRIDYFLISKNLRTELKDAGIFPQILGSDHCPVGIGLK